ncbi:MAG: methylmalonyl-CoA mutase subunit beta [Flavobacteriaceae bacterium]
MTNEGLFGAFNPVSEKQWKQLIQFELQGADYNKTLIWNSLEDIAVKPFYHPDSFQEIPFEIPPQNNWHICQSIFVHNVSASNKAAVNTIKNGAESILFILPSEEISITELLQNINPEQTSLHFELQFLNLDVVEALVNTSEKANTHINTDIIGHLAKTGNWYNNLKQDFANFSSIFKTTNTISINTVLYQNAGANMVQQLAYALAHANEYLLAISDQSGKIPPFKMVFNIAVGSHYFFEIAKLRALRVLWRTLAQEYGTNPNCHIVATPTKRNKTLYGSHTNMLRTTTECMGAILGGANTITNMAFDALYRKTNNFSKRIALNQLLILKNETFFKNIGNPSDGSYYIETLTQQLAEKALDLFKDIEANGGFLKQLKAGTIQRKIKESAKKEEELFKAKSLALVGSNKYNLETETVKEKLELYPFVKTKPRKTLIEPIIEKRLAENLEQARLEKE